VTAAGGTATFPSRLAVFAGDIKLHHTVFAMPWAILAAVLAGRTYPGTLSVGKIALIILCMVTARTVAMAANRLIDAELDAKNPRTARRAIPSGALSNRFVAGALAVCALGFAAATACFQIFYHNPWPVVLCPAILAFLCGYPFLKRFSRLSHYYLGAALALAPVCAWVAVSGRVDWAPTAMFVIVLAWTAGFDIIYACQDYANDVASGLFSIPAKLGIGPALWVSRLTHLAAAVMLVVLGLIVPWFGMLYFCGVALAVALLIVEQSLVKPGDLSRVNVSFFTINGIISLTVGMLGVIDLLK
jgi:4-hydroxybenzoate polyprenyltransferase